MGFFDSAIQGVKKAISKTKKSLDKLLSSIKLPTKKVKPKQITEVKKSLNKLPKKRRKVKASTVVSKKKVKVSKGRKRKVKTTPRKKYEKMLKMEEERRKFIERVQIKKEPTKVYKVIIDLLLPNVHSPDGWETRVFLNYTMRPEEIQSIVDREVQRLEEKYIYGNVTKVHVAEVVDGSIQGEYIAYSNDEVYEGMDYDEYIRYTENKKGVLLDKERFVEEIEEETIEDILEEEGIVDEEGEEVL